MELFGRGEISERCFLKSNYMKPDTKTLKEYIKVLKEEKEIAKMQVKLSYKGQHYESPQNSDLRLAAISFALNAVQSILENDKRNVARGEEKSFSKCLKCDTPIVCAMRNICSTKSK